MNRQKKWVLFVSAMLLGGAMAGCSSDSTTATTTATTPAFTIVSGGVFDTPGGASTPAAAMPGENYSFTFTATAGQKLGFATMYVQTNDLFYSPPEAGIDLFDSSGNAVTGDVTSQLLLLDAGTEVNQEPGVGADQAPRQSAPNTGADENGTVRLVSDVNDGFTYQATASVLQVTLAESAGTFTVTIAVDSGSTTPLSPGVFVIYTGTGPLFNLGVADFGQGLEALAEDGDPTALAASLGF